MINDLMPVIVVILFFGFIFGVFLYLRNGTENDIISEERKERIKKWLLWK